MKPKSSICSNSVSASYQPPNSLPQRPQAFTFIFLVPTVLPSTLCLSESYPSIKPHHLLTHLGNKYLLSAHYMSGIVQDSRGTILNQRHLFPEGTQSLQRGADRKVQYMVMMALQGGMRTLRVGLQPIKSSLIAPALPDLQFISFNGV